MYHPVAVPALPAVELPAVAVLPAAIPPAFIAIPIPINPVIAPALFPAAVFIASICPPTRRAAAVVGLVVIAFSSHSLIFLR